MSEYVPLTDQELLAELEPTAEKLFERHMSTAKEWFPHELVPWDRGKDFEPGEEFDEAVFPMKPGVRAALFLNLLTEDNLPHYNRILDDMFGPDGVWGEWNRQWTAEEGRHSIVMRDYVTVTRAVDSRKLERARMAQVSLGKVPNPGSIRDGIVYVALQELATRVSHRNTGKLLDDAAGEAVMSRVAADENLHYLFYRDLVSAALEIDPSGMVAAIERQVMNFEMPGTGVADFEVLAKDIGRVGIYTLGIHGEVVVAPVVQKHWRLHELKGLEPFAEQARENIDNRTNKLLNIAKREKSRQAAASS